MDTQQDISDEQILQSLLLRKEKLESQLARVNIAIDAFGEDVSTHVILPKGTRNANTDVNQETPNINISIPDNYNAQLSYPDKVLFVVSKAKNGAFVDEIVKYISESEQISNIAMLKHRITQTASKLYGKKKLKAKQEGRKYRYFLP